MLPIYASGSSSSSTRRQLRAPGTPLGPPPPAPAAAAPEDRATELTLRFAHALSRRQRVRRLLLPPSTPDDASASSRRHPTTVSKNCGATRRHRAREQQKAADKARSARLESAVRELRRTVASLERSQLLADAALLVWRTNRGGAALDICREYFAQFARGFNSADPQSAVTRAFMARAVEPDLVTRDFCGVEAFLAQWQTYTTCYDNFSARVCSLAVIDDGDHRCVSVSAAAEMRFAFSPRSLQALYPHLFAEMQTSAAARATTEKLFGRECRVAFDIVFHFNQRGKVFVTESRVHLASALLDLTADPFAAMRVLNASLITETGHWKTPESDVRESSIELPKSVL